METLYIETPHLVLRGFRPEDASGLFRILKSPAAACFMDEKLNDMDEARKSAIWRSLEPKSTQMVVCLKVSHEMIGYLFGMDEEPDTFSVGWNFNADFHGRGYATEAATAYFDYLFKERGIRRVYAYVSPGNVRSRRLCERLGMRLEGEIKEHISFMRDIRGVEIYEDTCIYALLKKEWECKNICQRV